MWKSAILLTFPYVVNKNSIYSRKFRVSGCMLFFNLGTKIYIIQSLGRYNILIFLLTMDENLTKILKYIFKKV